MGGPDHLLCQGSNLKIPTKTRSRIALFPDQQSIQHAKILTQYHSDSKELALHQFCESRGLKRNLDGNTALCVSKTVNLPEFCFIQ
jgi:hypothetical protein